MKGTGYVNPVGVESRRLTRAALHRGAGWCRAWRPGRTSSMLPKMVSTGEKRLWRVAKADKACELGHREPLEGFKADSGWDSQTVNDAADYNLKQEIRDPWMVEMEVQRERIKGGVLTSGLSSCFCKGPDRQTALPQPLAICISGFCICRVNQPRFRAVTAKSVGSMSPFLIPMPGKTLLPATPSL